MRTAQLKDPNLRPIIGWMESAKAAPEWNKALPLSEEMKELWRQWDLLVLVNGVLHSEWITVVGHTLWVQLIPPREIRREMIRLVHEGAAGHLGARKTVVQICRSTYWRGWRGDADRFCRAGDGAVATTAVTHRGRRTYKTCR